MHSVGYARVGDTDKDLTLQLDALERAGCERIFEDRVGSGTRTTGPALAKALAYLRPGDILMVWRLDRLGRSLVHLVATVTDLHTRGIGFCCLEGPINTTAPEGDVVLRTLQELARFERDVLVERTNAGLKAAVVGGKRLGRPPVIAAAKLEEARDLINAGSSVAEAARQMKISRPSLYRRLNLNPQNISDHRNAPTGEPDSVT